jgi:hypothetical protein
MYSLELNDMSIRRYMYMLLRVCHSLEPFLEPSLRLCGKNKQGGGGGGRRRNGRDRRNVRRDWKEERNRRQEGMQWKE